MKIRLKHLTSVLVIALTISTFGVLPKPAAAQGAWYAEFFGNRDLGGAPVLTRYDEVLDFDWGGGSPGSEVPADNFSARWTRSAWFDAGTYRFSYRSDDGLRVWVDDTLLVDDWQDQQAAWSFVDQFISRGTHTVTVEYYEHTGGARMQLAWERVGGGEAWRGEYYDTRDFEGSPTLVRYDAAIDFDWGDGSPDPSIPADNFSVRWERTLGFEAGTYRFFASVDDGVRIFVDGQMVVDAWYDQKLPNTHSGDITFGSGQHTVVVSYYEHGGEASAHVWWRRLGAFRGWEGRYYSNTELRGSPELIRDDPAIDFDWGEGAPVPWMPADNFSAVWEREVAFEAGTYRFNVRSDDGVRVWLDGGLVMDFWKPMDYEHHFVEGIDLEGTHAIRVEYFERTGGARIRFWWEREGGPSAPPATPTPPSVPPRVHRPGPWRGEYFDNPDLAGTPAFIREDPFIDFDWGRGTPAPELGRDNFSVRWTGTFSFPAGRYCFTTMSDDGVRLYVDDALVIDAWQEMRGTRTGCVNLSSGAHTVRVEYFERLVDATVRVTAQQVSAEPEPAPTPAPRADDRGPGGPWDAVYFDNAELEGDPVLARREETLDFNWNWDSPAPVVPSDNFSAIWTRQVDLSGGTYLFSTYSDDGVRLIIDGETVIDSWQPMRGYRNAVVSLSEGLHTVQLEYFEARGIALVRLDWRPR
jgi:hypothetical protein